jgi:hypothetical protein
MASFPREATFSILGVAAHEMLPQATVVHSSKLPSKLWEKRVRVNVEFRIYTRLVIKIRLILSFLSFLSRYRDLESARHYIQNIF